MLLKNYVDTDPAEVELSLIVTSLIVTSPKLLLEARALLSSSRFITSLTLPLILRKAFSK